MKPQLRPLLVLLTIVCSTAFATACAGADENRVVVTLKEWDVAIERGQPAAGDVRFTVSNIGPDDPHELAIVRTDLAPDELPTDDDGTVIEDAPELEVVGEIEDIPVNETRAKTFTLEPGTYVLICNITEEEDGEMESHYMEGMRTTLTVTP